ncbi:MAG: putative phosphohistidine phosphatase, SixA [Humibacillus sp.]|nr:putative phosphohistidine phosphatase, SixA [Humibacillus sp.]
MLGGMSTAPRPRTLVLMRHGKAEEGFDKPDHDRELAPRGRADAAAAGRWLRDEGLVPDLVLCSSATRTRQTWEQVSAGGAECDAVEFSRTLYLAGADAVLETVRGDAGASEAVRTVLVIGHNPTTAELTSVLSDGSGSAAAHDGLSQGFVTSGLAVLAVPGEWADLDAGTCVLERFHVPRGQRSDRADS